MMGTVLTPVDGGQVPGPHCDRYDSVDRQEEGRWPAGTARHHGLVAKSTLACSRLSAILSAAFRTVSDFVPDPSPFATPCKRQAAHSTDLVG